MNCTVNSMTHQWTVTNSSETIAIIDTDGDFYSEFEGSIDAFMFKREARDPLISSVSVVVNPELDGTVVRCFDGDRRAGSGEMQEATINVLTNGKFLKPYGQ